MLLGKDQTAEDKVMIFIKEQFGITPSFSTISSRIMPVKIGS